jgi:hypothetical protein
MDSSVLSDKELDSSLESETGCEEDDDYEIDGGHLDTLGSSELGSKTTTNDGGCLTQDEVAGLSGSQKPLSSSDFTTCGNMTDSNLQPASMSGLEELVATKSYAGTFCTKCMYRCTVCFVSDVFAFIVVPYNCAPYIYFLVPNSCNYVFSHSPTVYLLSQIRISMEYSLRPPLFILCLLSEMI